MPLSASLKQKLGFVLLATLALRLLAMWLIPLTDTTEARYGEIARKMLETNNWVTPLHDYGVPFWAKPPLSTWISAISMKLFGVNEFAVRLPSLLLCLGICALIYQWLKKRSDDVNIIAITVLATSLLFFISAGLVMTDLTLIFASTLAMICFWQAAVENKYKDNTAKMWGYLFFIALAIGLLGKGPLILVLVGLPTGLWTLLHRQLKAVWCRLPWITGVLLMLVIAVPWYYLAEKRTPGFLNYFIIGEHFNRFLVSGWSGDRYGHAHSEPLGIIWLYLLGGFLPWAGLAIALIYKHKKEISWARPSKIRKYFINNSWMSYLVLWSVMPVIFFTFAHNIIPPYALPAMPACAILLAEFFLRYNKEPHGEHKEKNEFNEKPFYVASIFTFAVFSIAVFAYFALPNSVPKRSEKEMMSAFNELRKDENSKLVYYKERLYSADFYSAGKAKVLESFSDAPALLNNNSVDFIAVDKGFADNDIKAFLADHFKKVAEIHKVSLYQECEYQSPCQH